MPKEILLYDDIYSWSASRAVSELEAIKSSPEVVLRFNGDGGELRYGWAVIGKANELKGKKVFKNDGEANSMYAFAFCYNSGKNEALDTSVFKFHRASYGTDYEASYMTEAEKAELIDKNNKLRAAMEARMDIPEFERTIECSLDQFFSLDGRIERQLNAEQALKCKLIDVITPITPDYSAQVQALASHFSPLRAVAKADPTPTPINTTMTIEEIKAKYPEAYKAIYAKGLARGIEKEFDRAGSILAHIGADQKGVLEAWKSGKQLTATQQSEFAIKAVTKTAAAAIEAESAEPVTTAGGNESLPDGQPKPGAKTEAKAADKKVQAEFHNAMQEQLNQRFPNRQKTA